MIELILLSTTVKTASKNSKRFKSYRITQEAMALSRHDWKFFDWDVKPQHNQPKVIEVSKSAFSWFLGSIIWKIPMYLINIHEDFMTS